MNIFIKLLSSVGMGMAIVAALCSGMFFIVYRLPGLGDTGVILFLCGVLVAMISGWIFFML